VEICLNKASVQNMVETTNKVEETV